MTVSALLSAASSLVSTQAAWCKGANARDSAGVECPYDSNRAVAWDIFGALKRAEYNGSFSVSDFEGAYAHIVAKIPVSFHHDNKELGYYNDSLIFSEVAAMFT